MRTVTSPDQPPSPFGRQPIDPLPLRIERPTPEPLPVGEGRKPVQRSARRGLGRRFVARALAGTGAFVLLGAALVAWVLPGYVRRQCIAEAAAQGIVLSIDSAAIDMDGFRLNGVHGAITDVPGLSARVPEVRVQTSRLRPQSVAMHGAELTLEGSVSHLGSALAKWRAGAAGRDSGATPPASVTIDDSRVAWQGVIGENARVAADAVHVEVTWRVHDPELHLRSDRVVVEVPGGALGPWRVDFDSVPASAAGDHSPVPASSRLRLALDPGVPDASTVLIMANGERTTSVDVAVPRSPLSRLGVPAAIVGLHGKDLQLQVSAHYAASGPMRADARTQGGIYGIEAAGLPLPIDVSWQATAAGAPATGLDVSAGRLAVGPLVGAMKGMLKPFDDGFRIDLGWKAGPVPCKAFDTALPGRSPFDIAYELRKLAEATGLTKIDGEVSARGSLSFDSRDLGMARFEFAPDANCQVAVFAP
jgi:hypothetical protein